jgi:hypothetical protein
MPSFTGRLVAFAMCVVVSACVSPAQPVQNKNDMLAAAGFRLAPATTPQRQASLASLPPHKFVRQERGDKVIYVYADPTICGCLYFGNQAAYGRYRESVFQKRLADEKQMTAETNQNIDWDPWGSLAW